MALPWFAEEARLHPKYDLDFQPMYIASSGIVTAAMSGGKGAVALVGGEEPIRAFIGGNTDFVFIGSVKNVLTHSIMCKPEIKKPEDLKAKKVGVGRIGGNSYYFKVVSQFMHMMAESYKIMVTDRDLAFRLMSKKIGLTDRKVFDAAYSAELRCWNRALK